MRVKIHVQGLKGSEMIQEGEEAVAMINGVLEVDGHLIEEVSRVDACFKGGEFATIRAYLTPGSFEVVTHNKESWPELLRNLEELRDLRDGAGRIIVSKEEADPPIRLLPPENE